ncbi:hypothetical protein RB653_002096 [Dictyostelium firmibasis]|uniref:E3 ubiquitin protein ligase n=1 Tax=Dictyostelium firmibasis TaxID=79012 RepID=A0AAN7U7X9_9MYCE
MSMDHQDLKRRDPPVDSESQRPSKKISLSSSEASVPTGGPPIDQNLILFQNRAMKVRVEEQKIEINDREQKIKQLNTKIHQYKENISCLCRVWDQLNSGLDLLINRVDFENAMDNLLPKDNITESFEFLSSYITEPVTLDEKYTLDQNLQKKVQRTQSTFSKISKALEKEHILSKFVFRLLKSKEGIKSNDIEKLLKEDNDKLSKQNQYIQNIYDKIQIQFKQLTDQTTHLVDQAAVYQQNYKDLRLELEKSQDELTIERKRVIKLQDETLRTPQVKIPSPSLGSNMPGGANNNNSNNNSNINNGNNMGGSSSLASSTNGVNKLSNDINGKELTHEEMVAEIQRQSDSRLLEARKLREEKAILLKELQQIQIDIRVIPEERIQNSMPYQVLRQRYQLVSDELDIHRNQCTKLQNDLTQATIGRRLEREALEAFEAHRRLNIERRVIQLEAESIDLKGEKEKLVCLIEQRNPNVPSLQYIQESRLLLDKKDEEIKQLRKEIEQLKLDIEKYKTPKEEIERYKVLIQRDVEAKNIEINKLLEKINTITKLNNELKSNEQQLKQKESELTLSLNILKSNKNNININNLDNNNGKDNIEDNSKIKQEQPKDKIDNNDNNDNNNNNNNNNSNDIKKEVEEIKKEQEQKDKEMIDIEKLTEHTTDNKNEQQLTDTTKNETTPTENDNNIENNNNENKDKIIFNLELSESKLKLELSTVKQQLEEITKIKEGHDKEIEVINEKFKAQIKELDITISQNKAQQESQRQELEALVMEIDSMGKAYEQMLEQNTRLAKQLSDKEDTHAHLMAENIKSQQTIRNSKEVQLAIEEKLNRNEEKLKSQGELMQKIEEKSNILQKQLSKVTEDLHICSFDLEKHKRFVRENNAHSLELKTQLDHLSNLNAELKKKADDSIFALEREIDKAKRLDEEKQLLKKKLEKSTSNNNNNSNNNSNNSSSSEEELKLINQRLRCTICNDRQKNYVIAKCFHVFCKECIYSNIDTRKRRCPSCNRAFAETDVHQIYY